MMAPAFLNAADIECEGLAKTPERGGERESHKAEWTGETSR